MKFYIEMTLLPSAEINMNYLWEKIFPQVHLALVEQSDEDEGRIGVSWPNYRFDENRKTVGNKLRLFADKKERLDALNLTEFLARLSDYVHVRSVAEVPHSIGYGCFYSINLDESNKKLARRFSKKHGITEAQALKRLSNRQIRFRKEPFVRTKSMNGGYKFNLVIGFKPETEIKGSFNKSYGLSLIRDSATVPIF